MYPIYRMLAIAVEARNNCAKSSFDHDNWLYKWKDIIKSIVKEEFPSGSGFDSGVSLVLGDSHGEKLVFSVSFHHMVEGYYAGWTDHIVIVTPSLSHGYNIKVTGRNRNGIKEYIAESFIACLDKMSEWNKYIKE